MSVQSLPANSANEDDMQFATCDWGYCDEPTVGVRWSSCTWLCVCQRHFNEAPENQRWQPLPADPNTEQE